MRGAGADNDDVREFKRTLAPSAWITATCGQGSSAIARARREALVDLDGCHFAFRAGQLREDCGVIACAAAEMEHLVAGAHDRADQGG